MSAVEAALEALRECHEASGRGDLDKARVWLRLANEATDEALGVPGRSAA